MGSGILSGMAQLPKSPTIWVLGGVVVFWLTLHIVHWLNGTFLVRR